MPVSKLKPQGAITYVIGARGAQRPILSQDIFAASYVSDSSNVKKVSLCEHQFVALCQGGP